MNKQQTLEGLSGGEAAQAVVTAWFKSEGETVHEGELLLEVESEKTISEIEAAHTGVLIRIVAAVGDEVEVGDVIAEFEVPE
jgi:pyruvate/2-oxoglutarate dehydrogenase complex dihydrolipoamide acyltransferase (E2) component